MSQRNPYWPAFGSPASIAAARQWRFGLSLPFAGFDFAGFFDGRAGAAFVVGVPGYSKMYTTDSGGTEAVAEYDPVGRVTDLSGNGNHWTQTVSASRSGASALNSGGLPCLTSGTNLNGGSPGWVEVDIPALTDTAGYTVICVGAIPATRGPAMFSRLRAVGAAADDIEGMYGDYNYNPAVSMLRGVSWYYEKDVTGVYKAPPTHRLAIGEFVRTDRNNFTLYASNDALAPAWNGPNAKSATYANGFAAPFKTLNVYQSSKSVLLSTIIIDGFLTDEERTTLYTFFGTLTAAIP